MSSLIIEVCKVDDIIKHPNADKLSLITLKGWNVIVGLDQYKIGDLVAYCPPDSIIPNNLIEKYDLEYLKKNGKVGRIKLRGYLSEGLVLDLPDGNWKEGDNLANILNITKWQPPEAPAMRGARKVSQKKINPNFVRYTDIENFKNFNDIFTEDDVVIITEKIHGCLQSKTKILLEDGTTKTIQELVETKYDGYLLGLNEYGNIVRSKITNWFDNGLSEDWLNISFVRPKQRGNEFYSLICTSNHQIYLPEYKKYINAKDLKINDKFLCCHFINDIPYHIKQVLIGIMLGDGSLEKNCVSFSHKKDHKEYMDYILDSLGYYAGNYQKERMSGFGTPMLSSRSISSEIIRDCFEFWKGDHGKIIPQNIELSPISLAFWYMDDGSLSHNENQEDRAMLHTCRYDINSITNAIDSLNKIGLYPKKYFVDNKYWVLQFNKKEAEKLFTLISPYIPNCMKYKLPEIYRNNNLFMFPKIELHQMTKVTEQKIINIVKAKTGGINLHKYDLETETHNFFANYVLVHNSNARYGNLEIVFDNKQPLFYQAKNWIRKNIFKETHEFVVGSHNVQISGNNNRHNYYSDDIWGRIAKKYNMKNIVPKDCIIYGEIYGNGIQDLTYGLKDIDVVIFDIKYKNEYLGWSDVWAFCNEHGLKTVPQLYIGNFSKEILDQYTNGLSLICPTQIREGIVVKTLEEGSHPKIGRKILKNLSANYLLRKNATEFK
jgi:tRNA-binding EMAP/Myf-like protein